MSVLIDTHVHFYPCYNNSLIWDQIRVRFEQYFHILKDENIAGAICLTERSDCDFYQNIFSKKEKRIYFSPDQTPYIETASKKKIFILPGFQIKTAENLEVLTLCTTKRIADGSPIAETIRQANDLGSITVIPWSLGKWWGKRGEIISDLIYDSSPSDFFIGDIALRPKLLGEPSQFKLAREKGFRFLYGSDPLPLKNQESQIGKLLSISEQSINEENPLEEIRSLIKNNTLSSYGSYNSSLQVLAKAVQQRL
jgi:hypothetical protein